ncbi:MAG: Shedu anti-phage system protein SduA domain-containing protein [bacterium]
MNLEEMFSPWDIEKVSKDLESAFENNSESELLNVLKNNSFLFYELYFRKSGIPPVFHEINFDGKLRCDFAWLNDNSDGPEWVLVEIERPKMKIFIKNNDPSFELNHAIEQIKSWRRYFDENPDAKKRIFGAVARFRFILVAGDKQNWDSNDAKKWRIDYNKETNIEIRSSDVFIRSLESLKNHPNDFWSFAEHPTSKSHFELKKFWENYLYISKWRSVL